MRLHTLSTFLAGGWKERSSVLGMIALAVVFVGWAFAPAERIVEFSARAAAMRELILNVLGVLGVLGLMKRDGGS